MALPHLQPFLLLLAELRDLFEGFLKPNWLDLLSRLDPDSCASKSSTFFLLIVILFPEPAYITEYNGDPFDVDLEFGEPLDDRLSELCELDAAWVCVPAELVYTHGRMLYADLDRPAVLL